MMKHGGRPIGASSPGTELERLINRRGPAWWDSAIRKGSRIALLQFGDKIAGYANYGRNRARSLHYDGEIYELYLRPEFQGLGFGRRLFTAARRDLAQSGTADRLIVWALSENDNAVEFYRALGGKAVARSSEKFGTECSTRWRSAGRAEPVIPGAPSASPESISTASAALLSAFLGQASQRPYQRGGLARHANLLQARCRSGRHRHLAGSDVERIGDQPAKRAIGFSVRRRDPHPRLEHGAAVGTALHPFDGVAAAARRQPHVDATPSAVAFHGASVTTLNRRWAGCRARSRNG